MLWWWSKLYSAISKDSRILICVTLTIVDQNRLTAISRLISALALKTLSLLQVSIFWWLLDASHIVVSRASKVWQRWLSCNLRNTRKITATLFQVSPCLLTKLKLSFLLYRNSTQGQLSALSHFCEVRVASVKAKRNTNTQFVTK